MKKYTLLLLLGSLLLTGCSIVKEQSSSELEDYEEEEEEAEIVTSTSSFDGEASEERSKEEASSEQESNERLVSNLKKADYNLFPQYYLEKFASYNSYKAVTEGTTESSVLFVTVNQAINVTAIKNGDYTYQYNKSESNMFSSEHIAYYHSDKAAYKEKNSKGKNDADYIVSSMSDYLTKFGIYPFANAIEGYITTEEALTSVTRKKSSDENFVFKLVLDKDNATTNVKVQMKEFGALDKEPEFSKIELTLTVKDDYTPVKIDLVSKYTAKQGASASCTQNYTVTFSNFNEDIEIPGLDNIKGLLD